jgi:hydroxymethylbilane synthase
LLDALRDVDHATTRHEVLVERAFLAELGSGCSLPIGAYADNRRMYTFLASFETGVTVSDTWDLSDGDLEVDMDIARRAAAASLEHVGRR